MAIPRDTPEIGSTSRIELGPEDAAHLKRLLSLFGTSAAAVTGVSTGEDENLDSERLYRRAHWLRTVRRERQNLLPPSMFGEPAWDVLIELYLAHARQRTSLTRLAESTGTPLTTLLRWLHYLSGQKLVTVMKSTTDARVSFVALSERGAATMTAFLREMPMMPD